MTKLELARKIKYGENWSLGYYTIAEFYSKAELLEMYKKMKKNEKKEA